MAIFKRAPASAEDWVKDGVLRFEKGHYLEAIHCFEKAIDIAPTYAKAWYNKGYALYKLGKNEESINCFDKALARDPKLLKAWNYRGEALQIIGLYDEAINSYNQALSLNSTWSQLWNNKGQAFLSLGNDKEALRCYDNALKINVNDPQSLFNRSFALFKLRRYEEALRNVETVLNIELSNAMAWNHKGVCLHELGRYDEAIVCYSKALEIDKGFSIAWSNIADTLLNLDRYPEALDCVDRALDLDNNNAHSWNLRGIILYNLGKNDDAINCYNTALDIEPDSTSIWQNKGLTLTELGKYVDAIVCFDKVLNIDSNNTIIADLRSELINKIPKITISLSTTNFVLNQWEQIELAIQNSGYVDANNISLNCSDVADVRFPYQKFSLKSNESIEITIGIRTTHVGRVPLDIIIKANYNYDQEHETRSRIWLNVSQDPTLLISNPDIYKPHKEIKPQDLPILDLSIFFQNYDKHELIGDGGFARVYRVERNGQSFAVKVPKMLDPAIGKTFISEIQNWTRLHHPNIVKVIDYNIMPTPFFEMEFCDSSLDKMMKPIDCEQAAWIIYNICHGLNYAHSLKIIHRDLKPHNILLKEGIPKISDWGLSRVITPSKSTTSTSFTPYYASPEQVNGKRKDERTDIWQLGAILYELITGTVPFQGESMMDVMIAIASKDAISPSDINPSAREIEPVILQCLEKNPDKRFQSVTELQKSLADYLKFSYTKLLKISQKANDYSKSAYLCGELLLIHLDSGDLPKAVVYGRDLIRYTSGEEQNALESLVEQMSFCIDEGLDDLPEELMRKAEWIVHGSRLEGMG